MPELEEFEDRTSGQVNRSQNLVYLLPYTTESIAEFLGPVLARIDPSSGGTQVVVVTRDSETALTISETILRIAGAGSIEVVPITSASRAGRIFKSRPVLAVAGTPTELGALVRSSLLKIDKVRTIVLAWADDILEEGPAAVAALEALLGELGEATRVIVARKAAPPIENLVERYARRARRIGAPETEAPPAVEDYQLPLIQSVTVGGSAKPAALRRLLDDLDPPSAVIVARDAPSIETVKQMLRTLGYREDDPSIRVTQSDFKNPTHTVIFFQPPVTPAELQRVAQVKPVQVVVLAKPGEVAWLRELTSGRLTPLNLHGADRRAHDRDEAMRQELRGILAKGVPARELISLEPLLNEFDASELAAAALHVLERERAQRRAVAENPPPAARARPLDGDKHKAGGMTRLFLTVGTRDGVKTGDLMGAIAGEGGIPGDHVGKIDLRESHALVEVAEADAAAVIARVNGTTIRGRRVVVRGERDREDRERTAAGRGDRPSRSDRPRGPRDRGGAPPRRGAPSERSSRGGPPGRNRDRS
ncbi:MAG: DbpA RNA binding domain-containing protein [Gemmatimonadaceae bacterium]